MLDVRFRARHQIVDDKNVPAPGQEIVAKMRAEKSGSARNHSSHHQ